jgi:glutathione S-transferase
MATSETAQAEIILHQFPLSHFCEKVRMVLTLKGLEYEARNHLPGMHLVTVRKLSGQTMVPVLQTEGRIIWDSNRIMKYLDERYPQILLYPKEKRKCAEMERFIQKVDAELGVHLRRYLYDMILPDLDLTCSLLAGNGYGSAQRAGFRVVAPLVRFMMRRGLKIHPAAVERSYRIVNRVLDELDATILRRKYFFGKAVSAADVTVASLIAPIVMPDHYPVDFPAELPAGVARFREACMKRPVYRWAEKFYTTL